MTTFREFLSSFDSDAGTRGRQFEHFVKWFLKNDPEWSTQVDQVWLWDEYPNSWGRDCGIDLVFKHKNGENWAVQAKCYAPTTSITKADVDSFISESNRDGIDKRLLIATTDLIGANAKQVCDAQDKPVTRFLLSHFEDADIEYPATLDDLPKAKRKDKPKPRDHQIEAIKAVVSNLKDVDRGQLIMACGTGKTFTTLWIKEGLGVESTLVLLPSLGLLSQTLHEWTLAANEEFHVLCVCSDESVGKKGSDEAVHSIADLAFPVTSRTGEIRAFLNSPGNKVIFSTYQSSPLIAEAQSDKAVPEFDLAIADEAHRCAGKVSGDFSTILDGEKIRVKKRLFTTATPRTYSSSVKKAAEDRGVEVVGMDDEVVFGKQLFALNFGEAIKRGLLTDYRVVIVGVDDPIISAWIENRELIKSDSDIEMDAESLAAQVGLLKAIKDYDLQRLISFHSRVSRAEDFSRDIHKVLGWIDEKHKPSGELISDFVSGEMPTDKRRRKLAQLKGLKESQRGLLTNARCLSEGVDVPSLDGVAFIDPRSSQIDIIQAVGRAIRLSDNKKSGTIVLPIFISSSDDPEVALVDSNFKQIWEVLNALKAHDDVLANELDQIRMEMGRRGKNAAQRGFSKISIDLPSTIDQAFANAFQTRLVELTTNSWDYWFGKYEKYVAETGDAHVSNVYKDPDGSYLGRWLSHQKGDRRFRLSSRRIKLLESIPGWSWDLWIDIAWSLGFERLKEYQQVHKNTDVPSLYCMSSDGYALGNWVAAQRQRRKLLSNERINLLESLSDWNWNVRDKAWEKGYQKLLEYVQQNNSAVVSQKFLCADGFSLGAWVSTQMRGRDKLDDRQKKLLEELPNWSWNYFDSKWEKGFKHLTEYLDCYKTTRVPHDYLHGDDSYRLGRWVSYQRSKKDELDLSKQNRLDNLGDWVWELPNTYWEDGISELLKYKKNFGNLLVPGKYENPETGFKLGKWVLNARRKYSTLDKLRISELESMSGWQWEVRTSQNEIAWNKGFNEFKKFVSDHAHGLVGINYCTPGEAYKLGSWVSRQRTNRYKLDPEKLKLLESIPEWVWANKR